ncbi:MAG: LTA synthase family protein [Bacillota bacterium]|nr:LTA synthase family protein [Bacillota bacterium]
MNTQHQHTAARSMPVTDIGAAKMDKERRQLSWQRPLLLFLYIFVMETLLHLYVYGHTGWLTLLHLSLFSLAYALLLNAICGLFGERGNYWLLLALAAATFILFGMQLVYYGIFKTPMMVFSLTKAGMAMEFYEETFPVIWDKGWQLLSFLALTALLLAALKKNCPHNRWPLQLANLALAALVFVLATLSLNLSDKGPHSAYTLYFNDNNPVLNQQELGVLTATRLEIERAVFGFSPKDPPSAVSIAEASAEEAAPAEPAAPNWQPNALDIDFAALAEAEQDEELRDMHLYFAAQQPTLQNEYTGMFAGCNLILVTAEGWSKLLLDTGMFPTMSKLATEGFEFSNFYTPIWNVSTSDGEYVATTGLLPKSGVWSYSASAENYMPFALGNQFAALGYAQPQAYHNHSYTYYDRHLSYPNMGYDYTGVGNGLNITAAWPESDLEMIEATVGNFSALENFHVYYLTVSGHLRYNFGGNNMAARHRDEVAELPYSEEVKAYIACNLELEYAMKLLLERLEAAGQLENTVIALTADHYPYGLSTEALNELAGHTVERSFELYENTLVIWKPGLRHQQISAPACSLDLLPTLSNLFGLPYDSRLLMGRDIFSESEPLVIFNDRSWISAYGRYNAVSGEFSGEADEQYVEAVNQIVNSKFYYSAKILERDYYRQILSQ